MHAVPEGNWFCAACEGGLLAGIKPAGRAGFLAAAAAAAAAAADKRSNASSSISSVPGASAAVPSIGPVPKQHLVFHSGALTESGVNKRAWDALLSKDENAKAKKAKQGAEVKQVKPLSAAAADAKAIVAPFPVPSECPPSVAVDCGGAKGEFVVLEGLVHCFCGGCEAAVAAGFQPTNVFGLQAFEFHGGKGSAGKWKASIKAFPHGFPTEGDAPGGAGAEEDEVAVAATKKGGRKGKNYSKKELREREEKEAKCQKKDKSVDANEGLGTWLERECPEHPCLARSRSNKENA